MGVCLAVRPGGSEPGKKSFLNDLVSDTLDCSLIFMYYCSNISVHTHNDKPSTHILCSMNGTVFKPRVIHSGAYYVICKIVEV